MSKNFETEQNELMEYLVYNLIYPKFSLETPHREIALEIFITTDCNKRCEYCYLQKHKEKLYPQHLNNPENIKNNCKLLLNHLLEKNIKVSCVDLYSGEIIENGDLWFDIMEMIKEASDAGLNVKKILIPTNASFMINDPVCDRVENLIKDFQDHDIRVILSISDDGGLLDEINRPLTSGEIQNKEKFYEKAKYFSTKYYFGFHPMVNAHSIEKWVDNFNWWYNYTKDFPPHDPLCTTMLLEVRNDEWTDDKIEYYLKFLKTVIESIPKTYPDLTIEDLTRLLCLKREAYIVRQGQKVRLPFANTYQPFALSAGDRISCSITQAFCVRLGDLAICPCHRLGYDNLLYGQYQVENDKITGIKANNVQFFINNMITGYAGFFKCDSCPINGYCLKGCRGAQYEIFKDVATPIPSVCNFMKVKVIYCFLNIIYLIEKNNLENLKGYGELFAAVLNELKKEDEEFYNKWKNVTYQNLLEV